MKTNHTITCPECQHSFSIESAFANQLRGKIEAEVQASYDARFAKERDTITRELTRTAQAEASRSHAVRVAELETAAIESDAALKRAQAQVETTRREATKLAREEFQAERAALETEMSRHCEASHEARKEFQAQVSAMDEQFQDQRNALELARSTELELRREKARLEGSRQELEVEVARKLDVRAHVSARRPRPHLGRRTRSDASGTRLRPLRNPKACAKPSTLSRRTGCVGRLKN